MEVPESRRGGHSVADPRNLSPARPGAVLFKEPLIQDWGSLDVASAEARQDHESRADQPVIVQLRHPPTIACGVQGLESDLLVGRDGLEKRGVAWAQLRRGGRLSYHGPGQVVAYVLAPLREMGLKPRDYVRGLIEAGAEALQSLSVPARGDVSSEPGLYVGGAKIGSVGVAIKAGSSRHGLSINVSVPRERISLLRWCGLPPEKVSSLEELGYDCGEEAVRKALSASLARFLGPGRGPGHEPRSIAGGGGRFPAWLKRSLPAEPQRLLEVRNSLQREKLHSICEEAQCPNASDCFRRGHVSFLVLGRVCTRGCPFCAVAKGKPAAPDPEEPARLARSVRELGLRRVVITMVDRDDLEDGGEGHLVECLRAVRASSPGTKIEMLTGDFRNCPDAPRVLVQAGPDTYSHNMETVPRLYAAVRPGAVYRRSLDLLQKVKVLDSALSTKSAVMAGMGETWQEMKEVLGDLRSVGCDRLVVGQYLAPRPAETAGDAEIRPPDPVFMGPGYFRRVEETGLELGFSHVEASPWARSSSHD